MLDYVNNSMIDSSFENNFYINYCNSLDSFEVNQNIEKTNEKFNTKSVQFVLMHPPYMDIVKFTDNENDMSKIDNINEFVKKFKIICENSLKYLDKDRYFAVVIGDVYKNSEVFTFGILLYGYDKTKF